MGFKGWVDHFTGPDSLDNAPASPPEVELRRFDQAVAAVLGWRPKADPAEWAGGPDKKKATRTVASRKGQRGRQDGAQYP